MNIPSIESLYATIEQQQRVIKQSHEDIAELKSALREAKEALVMNIVGTGGRTPAAHNAIATTNKVLGEE